VGSIRYMVDSVSASYGGKYQRTMSKVWWWMAGVYLEQEAASAVVAGGVTI
jgi:hypothetical protein